MAMQVGGSKKPYNEINITPFVDVVLVLLIIFILMTTAAVQGIKVDLPSASSAKTLEAQKSRVIAVSNDGTVSIDAIPVSMSELETQLRSSIASASPVSERSATSKWASPPELRIDSTRDSADSTDLRQWTSTRAPARDNSHAIARPTPLDEPVMTTPSPSSRQNPLDNSCALSLIVQHARPFVRRFPECTQGQSPPSISAEFLHSTH